MGRDAVDFFRLNPYTRGFTASQKAAVGSRTERLEISRGGELWSADEPAAVVLFVRSGIIRIYRQPPGGRELTLHLVSRSELLGQVAPLSGTDRKTHAVAHMDAVAYTMPVDLFMSLLSTNKAFSSMVTRTCARRRQAVEDRVQALLFKSADARLATIFLELAADFGVRDSRGVILNLRLTHRDLAALIGATRETVSFAIQDLRKAGLIQTESMRVILVDRPGLEVLAAP